MQWFPRVQVSGVLKPCLVLGALAGIWLIMFNCYLTFCVFNVLFKSLRFLIHIASREAHPVGLSAVRAREK